MDLGIFANDPRARVIYPQRRVRAGRATIVSTNGERWMVNIDNATDVFFGTVEQCLAFVLGEPAQVGPTGIRDWLHTDGRIYRHDPATTGMLFANALHTCDVVDWPGQEPFEILGSAQSRKNDLRQWRMAYPIQFTDGLRGWYFYGDDDLVPVRFQD